MIKRVEDKYRHNALSIDYIDGINMEFADWRFNLRCFDTELVLRLNVEAHCDADLMREKTSELLNYIDD